MKNGKGNPPITDESFWSSSTCCFPEAPFLQILYPGMDRMWPLGCSLFNASASGLFHSLPSGAVASEVCKSA